MTFGYRDKFQRPDTVNETLTDDDAPEAPPADVPEDTSGDLLAPPAAVFTDQQFEGGGQA